LALKEHAMKNTTVTSLGLLAGVSLLALAGAGSAQESYPADGSVLPFPPAPLDSIAAPTLAESTLVRRQPVNHLPADAPNILIILMDDVGFGIPDTFGGYAHTPTLSALADEGIAYNTFHTTAICSPTRAALLTGRNQHNVGSGTIAERAVDWDGYTGVIPKSAATIAEILHQHGYATAAFGKWHNTPATETTAMGPFDRWPTGYGFETFYGFLAGEATQYEPPLVRNTTIIDIPETENYHLTTDLADQAITWLRQRQAFAPDRPFFMYWAPGASHGPHHIFPEWADRYDGQFDDGWDALRERTYANQLELGWIPEGTELTPRPDTLAGWDSIPEEQREFQTRLMEVFAGFTEHADVEAGRLVDEIDRLGLGDNTIIFYIYGDNGPSAEGQTGTVSELLAQNNIPSDISQHLAAVEARGGLEALGGPLFDNMYHAGWAWAGSTPFQSTKLVAAHFGGTRNPLVVSWPDGITPDGVVRDQFYHVIDIAPTIYDILDIAPPAVVNGQPQDPLDGVSMLSSFADPEAASLRLEQYFENSGSRAIYQDGWVAAAFGPLTPWATGGVDFSTWDSRTDVWELYNVAEDFSQARDLSAENPEKLAELQAAFERVAAENQVNPIGAGLWLRIHPEDRVAPPYTSWSFDESTQRMPEFTAPGLGRQSNSVTVEASFEDGADGVLYALGGVGGGLALYMQDGVLTYEYNMMIIENYKGSSPAPIPGGDHVIEVTTTIAGPGRPGEVVVTVDGAESFRVALARTVPAAFTASETFDVGADLGSPVSLAYVDAHPFTFTGNIAAVRVALR
jgi:arylsulfatase